MFDPTKPADHSPLSSAEMRAQLNALNDKVDAVPAGPPGPPGAVGPAGPPVTDVVVDAVNTLNPDDPATVSSTFDGTNVHLTLGLPRGHDGAPGPNGNDGSPGPQGEKGDKGDPGDVSATQLSDGLAATLASANANSSANTNAVPTLDTPFTNDPPTLADMELMRAAYNTLVLAQRR